MFYDAIEGHKTLKLNLGLLQNFSKDTKSVITSFDLS